MVNEWMWWPSQRDAIFLKLDYAYESPEDADSDSTALRWDQDSAFLTAPGNADATRVCTTV